MAKKREIGGLEAVVKDKSSGKLATKGAKASKVAKIREVVSNGLSRARNFSSAVVNGTDKYIAGPVAKYGFKYIAPVTYLVGANVIALGAMNNAYDLLESSMKTVVGAEGIKNYMMYMNNNPNIKNGLTLASYVSVLGLFNYGIPRWILPNNIAGKAMKKLNDLYLNHLSPYGISKKLYNLDIKNRFVKYTSAAVLGVALFNSYNYLNMEKFYHRTRANFAVADNVSTHMSASAKTLYSVGRRGEVIIEAGKKAADGAGKIGTTIVDETGKAAKVVFKDIKEIIAGIDDMRRIYLGDQAIDEKISFDKFKTKNPNFDYENDRISQLAMPFIQKGMFSNPEEFLYFVRVVYFESVFNKKLSAQETKEAMEDVAQCMFNRWNLDNALLKSNEETIFSKGRGITINDIVYNGWQFTATKLKKTREYLNPEVSGNQYDLYKNGKLNLSVGKMSSRRAEIALEASLNVLAEEYNNRIGFATYYQNPDYVDKNNKDWEGRYGLKKTGYSAYGHHFYIHPLYMKYFDNNYVPKSNKSETSPTIPRIKPLKEKIKKGTSLYANTEQQTISVPKEKCEIETTKSKYNNPIYSVDLGDDACRIYKRAIGEYVSNSVGTKITGPFMKGKDGSLVSVDLSKPYRGEILYLKM